MYGEDIDWSYQILKAGWKNYYVPTTQIIHYKGESARHGSFNRVKHFYNAMRIFNRKHSRLGGLSRIFIEFGILIGELSAVFKKNSYVWIPALFDSIITFLIFILAFYIRFTFFPSIWGPPPVNLTSGMWYVSILYGIITGTVLALTGVYNLKYFN